MTERLERVLEEASGIEATTDRWGPCCDLPGAKRVGIGTRVYLRPINDATEIALMAFPADTLMGARAFYKHSRFVGEVRKLARGDGWSVSPSFRFGFWDSTWIVETQEDIDVASYIALWTERVPNTKRLRPREWDAFLQWLVEKHVATDDDRTNFDRYFRGQRALPFADPRPGLEVNRRWSIADAEELDAGGRLVPAVREAYGALIALCSA